MKKPSYRLSRHYLWAAFWLAWLTIAALVAGALAGSAEAVALAPTLAPSMVLLIVALLGIHRAFGSMDMRALTEKADAVVDPVSET